VDEGFVKVQDEAFFALVFRRDGREERLFFSVLEAVKNQDSQLGIVEDIRGQQEFHFRHYE
jgi:hypothetical protein